VYFARRVARASVITILLVLNLAFWGTGVFLGGLFKFLTFGRARRRVILFLAWLAERWSFFNDAIFDTFLDVEWDIEGVDSLRHDGHYLVVANHVTWIDIFAVLRAFRGHAPFLRFFLKGALLWAPVVGQACWALEFPFMKRYSPEYLAKHPEKRGRDLETTRKACQRYRTLPVTILNFAEGTRFTKEKQEEQRSPYEWLLRPRVGGVSFVLASLGEQLDAMLDVTLAYPGHEVTILDFVRNKVPKVMVRVRRLAVPPQFYTAAVTEPGPVRDEFRRWLEDVWREKNATIGRLLG
jgi:1-acyl-sn-glycerol-3-phosphate acyltransferase